MQLPRGLALEESNRGLAFGLKGQRVEMGSLVGKSSRGSLRARDWGCGDGDEDGKEGSQGWVKVSISDCSGCCKKIPRAGGNDRSSSLTVLEAGDSDINADSATGEALLPGWEQVLLCLGAQVADGGGSSLGSLLQGH